MATAIDIRELPARLEEALALASSGREVLLLDGALPCARIISYRSAAARVPGLHPGAIQPAPDFDAPLTEDFWNGPS